ncbi:F-box/kelch-repeat protein At3g06240-like [Prosopis cineraria]|uniref:F-box/kelch-repeat protein At3g06240-like n=1 Tax=Prosopis cineraria TaxID=364024 RepID=UPI00240F1A3F|nr:F-box/kelch-repeat protein At3g06240-like [Prosopis cineraria]
MDNLPRDLKLEILLHLPIKSLLGLKCTSKSWLSLISNPYFVKLHFQRSSQHPDRILYAVGSQMLSIDFNASLHDDSAVVKLDLPFFKSHVDVDFMATSCRGFVFLAPTNEQKIFLLNPSTRVCKQIPVPDPHNSIFLYGFCYDEFADDYLLVLASKYKKLDPSSDFLLGFDVFSIRTNSWQKHGNLIINHANVPTVGFISNDAIHWIVRTPSAVKMIAFDITTKNLREVPMPFDFDGCFIGLYDLRVLEGCLTLIFSRDDQDEMWVMREYGVKSSWTNYYKLFSLSCKRDICYILPLCFTKDGQLLVVDDHIGLSKWSDKGELQERRQYFTQEITRRRPLCCCLGSCYYSATAYTETLLSLP